MTYQELFVKTRYNFERAGIREPDIDARLLLMHVAGLSPSKLFLRMPETVPDDILRDMEKLSEKRAGRYPLQYILGVQGFYGLDFIVREGVLIPRADTEILVDEALKHLKDGDEVLDLCTGSGCVLIALMAHRKLKRGVGVDRSAEALALSAENSKRLKASPVPEWIRSDLFSEIQSEIKFDVITANPPYIDSEVLAGLQPEVKDFEPKEALDGGKGGLDLYDPLVRGAAEHLRPGGWLVTETGFDQGRAVSEIFIKAGFENVRVIKDLASDDRVVKGQYNVRQA